VLDAAGSHELVFGHALMEGVGLDLADRRGDLVVLDEVHEPVAGEVGHANGPDQALLVQVLHGPPRRFCCSCCCACACGLPLVRDPMKMPRNGG